MSVHENLDDLLTTDDLMAVTKRARSTLEKDRLSGNGIPFVRFGRLVRYRRRDVQAWLDGLATHQSTSEPA